MARGFGFPLDWAASVALDRLSEVGVCLSPDRSTSSNQRYALNEQMRRHFGGDEAIGSLLDLLTREWHATGPPWAAELVPNPSPGLNRCIVVVTLASGKKCRLDVADGRGPHDSRGEEAYLRVTCSPSEASVVPVIVLHVAAAVAEIESRRARRRVEAAAKEAKEAKATKAHQPGPPKPTRPVPGAGAAEGTGEVGEAASGGRRTV